ADAGKKADVAEPQVAGDLVFLAALPGEGRQGIHLGGADAGILQGIADGHAGQLGLGGFEALGKGGLADTDDGGPVLDGHGAAPPAAGKGGSSATSQRSARRCQGLSAPALAGRATVTLTRVHRASSAFTSTATSTQ